MIFDDVFSGLDSATKRVILNNLFGPRGLLREGNLTVVLASSDGQYRGVRLLPHSNSGVNTGSQSSYADQVLLLDENGHATEQSPGQTSMLESQPTGSLEDELKNVLEAQIKSINTNTLTDLDIKADATRQLGDSAMYKFYAQGAGWPALLMFCIAMCVFAACDSFPSE